MGLSKATAMCVTASVFSCSSMSSEDMTPTVAFTSCPSGALWLGRGEKWARNSS